jgi:broad specificity phosphatase PhoE
MSDPYQASCHLDRRCHRVLATATSARGQPDPRSTGRSGAWRWSHPTQPVRRDPRYHAPRVSTLLLIRHGQASYGAADYDRLSPLGVRQAEVLGVHIVRAGHRIDAVCSGPLRRQIDTAEGLRRAAAAVGLELPPVRVIDELAEYPAFQLLYRLLPRFAAEDPDLAPLTRGVVGESTHHLLDRAFNHVMGAWHRGEIHADDHPGIESFEAFVDRIRRGLEAIMSAHGGGQQIAVVTSGGPISVAVKLALGLTPEATMNLGRAIRNASVTEVRWRSRGFGWAPGDFSLYGFNHVHHLSDDLVTYR